LCHNEKEAHGEIQEWYNGARCNRNLIVFFSSPSCAIYSTESGSGTASGQKLNPAALTAAHRNLPFGTKVRVTNKNNGRSVVVIINDRGPFVRGRVIDVTPAAARALGFSGLTQVTLNVGAHGDHESED
jgi:rare lipoprotein A